LKSCGSLQHSRTTLVQSYQRLVVAVMRHTSRVHLDCNLRDAYELHQCNQSKSQNKVAYRQQTDNDALSSRVKHHDHIFSVRLR